MRTYKVGFRSAMEDPKLSGMACLTTLLFILLSFFYCSRGIPLSHERLYYAELARRDSGDDQGFYDPSLNGGSMLTIAPNTGGLHEPINIIISAESDSQVLNTTDTTAGVLNYFQSFGFSTECLGIHLGDPQTANLGDDNGEVDQAGEMRLDFGDTVIGTCLESYQGGNHFRYWVQNGSEANSGALFLAVGYELPADDYHDPIVNGYNLGRDWLVGNATSQSSVIDTSSLTNSSTFSGSASHGGYTYQTSVKYVSGLLNATSDGINHAAEVAPGGQPAVDGLVAVMTVKVGTEVVKNIENGACSRSHPSSIRQLPALVALSTLLLSCLLS